MGGLGEVLSERIGAEEIEITLDDAPLVIEWSDPEGVPTADGGLAETKSAAKSTADVVVSLPVEAGRRTLRFAITTPPAPGAEIVVTLPAGAIEDYYNNATTEPTTFSFTWPATDTILNDTRAPRLGRASVIQGCVEMVFDEEIDPATWSAATIDQGAVDWASCENGFGLCQQTCLATGAAHTLELGATLADLAGNALHGGAVGHGFDLSATDTLHIWRRPDPRLLTSATGSVVDKSVSSAVRQALGFHGLPIDPETGLVYVRHRYYDPEMGRFLSQDPLGYVDAGNLYQYGLNNPGDLSDPLGLYTGSQEEIDYLLQFSTNNPGDQAAIARAQRTAISNAVGMMPGVGDAHDLVQASAGVDVITGDRLSARDRAVVVVAAAVPFVGGPALRWAAGTAPGRWVMDGVGWLWSKVPRIGNESGFVTVDLLTGSGRNPAAADEIVPADQTTFLRSAAASFGEDSVFRSARLVDGSVVVQRSDLEWSIENVRLMARGNTPFVKNTMGQWERINLHHVGRQDGKLIEVLKSHNRYDPITGGPLHIPGPGSPARDREWNRRYWRQRLADAANRGLVLSSANCSYNGRHAASSAYRS
jgi:RHS repeat-associated protein